MGDGEGQGGLACFSPWGCKKLDTTRQLNNNRTVQAWIPTVFKGVSHQRHSPLLWNTTLRCSDALKAQMYHQLLWEVLMLQQAGDCPDVLGWWYPVKRENVFVRTNKILSGGLPWWLSGEDSACQCRRLGLDPWVRRISPGEGNGNPLHNSFLGNTMDRGAWWAAVHGIAKET